MILRFHKRNVSWPHPTNPGALVVPGEKFRFGSGPPRRTPLSTGGFDPRPLLWSAVYNATRATKFFHLFCALEPASQILNLRANCIKDAGVEAMSCATLGQEYSDHKKRQSRVRRQLCVLNATSGTRRVNALEAQQSGRPTTESDSVSVVQTLQEATPGDLPPLAGTPLYAAATRTWPNTRHQSPRMKAPPRLTAWSVVLDGNMVSERVVAGQGALAGLGEVALFRGCVLPETAAVNQSWARDAFWTKTGAGRVLSRGG